MARRDPIEILFLGPVIVRPVEERDEADWMPAQGVDESGRDLGLAIVVGYGTTEKASAMRRGGSRKRPCRGLSRRSGRKSSKADASVTVAPPWLPGAKREGRLKFHPPLANKYCGVPSQVKFPCLRAMNLP
jgi:hypothetical protein